MKSYQSWMASMTEELRKLALDSIDPKKGTVIKRDCGCVWQLQLEEYPEGGDHYTMALFWTCDECQKPTLESIANLALYGEPRGQRPCRVDEGDTRGRMEP